MVAGSQRDELLLERLHDDLRGVARRGTDLLAVPEFLLGGTGTATARVPGAAFLAARVRDALDGLHGGTPGPPELVYGTFIPTFASFGGRIGSLLSFLACLPWLRSELRADTVISLPLSVIGRAGRKGVRGSPFAARDPFGIDPAYADPLLPGWAAHDLYAAVAAACRRLGARFGTILPLATLAIDSPLLAAFPDLAYWWHAQPGVRLRAAPGPGDPAISASARAMFADAPRRGEVRAWPAPGGPWLAAGPDGPGLRTPANAIPDVTPDMALTYTWEDVVSVNYTALSYPVPHARHRQAPADRGKAAWRVMPEVVAWHLRHGESAFVIDVQSSVPGDIVRCGARLAAGGARLRAGPACCAAAGRPAASDEPPWIIGEELWDFTSPAAPDAVVGPFLTSAAPYAGDPPQLAESLRYHVGLLARTRAPLPFLAGAGNHDTRPAGASMARPLLLFLAMLPGAIPFMFAGTEHGLTVPVNREFGYSRDEQQDLPYDRLQMFSPRPLDWDAHGGASHGGGSLVPLIRLLRAARQAARDCVRPGRPLRDLPLPGQPLAAGYVARGDGCRAVTVLANLDPAGPARLPLDVPPGERVLAWAGAGPPVRASRCFLEVGPLTAVALLPAGRGARWPAGPGAGAAVLRTGPDGGPVLTPAPGPGDGPR